jgi:protein-tyrosine phosphatase
MSEILLVCTGNICRSPMAEGFLRAAFAVRLGEVAPVVASAGTAGWDGSGATDEAVRSAHERGVDIEGHLARKLRGEMLEDADLIVCMAAEHRKAIVGAMPDLEAKTFTIKELVRLLESSPAEGSLEARFAAAAAARNGSSPPDEDVRDPLGDTIDGYRQVADELFDLADRLTVALTRDPG